MTRGRGDAAQDEVNRRISVANLLGAGELPTSERSRQVTRITYSIFSTYLLNKMMDIYDGR